MKKSQFIHIEEYSLIRKGDKPDAIGVLKEARREQSHSKHIKSKKKIMTIEGKTLHRAEVELLNASNKKFNGKALRKDARVLLAGVASFPIAFTDSAFDANEVKKWINDTRQFLRDEFGEYLQSIVLHGDETYPHLHFYCYDLSSMSVKNFHPGNLAEAGLTSNSKKARVSAFKTGLMSFQDSYFNKVSKKFELARKNDIATIRLNKTAKKKFDDMSRHVNDLNLKLVDVQHELAKANRTIADNELDLKALKSQLSMKSMEIDKLKATLERVWDIAFAKAKALLQKKAKVKAIVDDEHFGHLSLNDYEP